MEEKDLEVLRKCAGYESVTQDHGVYKVRARWRPHKNLVQAFKVIDALEAKGWRWDLQGGPEGGVMCLFKRGSHTQVSKGKDYGDTPAEAICNAALKVLQD